MNYLGSYFRDQRIQQGLTRGELARIVGYRNERKGVNKIIRFEMTGEVTEDLLVNLAEVLDVHPERILELVEQHRIRR